MGTPFSSKLGAGWAQPLELEYHTKKKGVAPSVEFIVTKADQIREVVRQVPKYIKKIIEKEPEFKPREGELIAIGKFDEIPRYGYYAAKPRPHIEKVWLDEVNYPHRTESIEFILNKDMMKTTKWRGKYGKKI